MPIWLKILWASPNSAIGLLIAVASWPIRGKVTIQGRTLEACGPLVHLVFRGIPLIRGGPAAMTLGHVILARDQCELDRCRNHELVHVRQYERWGPLFLPAYLFFTVEAWARGHRPYLDNRFEREAYGRDPI